MSFPRKYQLLLVITAFLGLLYFWQKSVVPSYAPIKLAVIKLKVPSKIGTKKKSTASIEILKENSPSFQGTCGIKLHGNSTLLAAKKSYKIEFRDLQGNGKSEQVLDFLPEEDFILLANAFDKSFTRNALVFHIWEQLGHYTPKYHYCELYINEEFQGLYMFIEKIKVGPNRLDLFVDQPLDSKQTRKPFLIKQDWDYSSIPSYTTSLTGSYLSYKPIYPKNSSWSARDSIAKFIKKVEDSFNAISQKEQKNQYYSQHIDLTSFVDFFLVNELAKNPDGFKSSTYLYTKQAIQQTNPYLGKLYIGPIWDFDLAFNNVQYENYHKAAGWIFEETGDSSHLNKMPTWWYLLTCDATFKQLCLERFNYLQEKFPLSHCHAFLNHFQEELHHPILKDQKKWPKTSPSQTNFLGQALVDQEQDFQRIKNFYKKRVQWLEKHISKIPCSHIARVKNELKYTKEIPPNQSKQVFEIVLPEDILNANQQPSFYSFHIIDVFGTVIKKGSIENTSLNISYKDWPSGTYYIDISESYEIDHLRPVTSAAYISYTLLYKLSVPKVN